jgi:hypothetical protein
MIDIVSHQEDRLQFCVSANIDLVRTCKFWVDNLVQEFSSNPGEWE